MLIATQLRCEYLYEPLGIDFAVPRLTWIPCGSGQIQQAYQIQAYSQNAQWDSGRIDSRQSAHIPCQLPLQSRDRITWRVRLWDELGEGEWSPEAHFEMGLLHPSDWCAQWINPELHTFDPDAFEPASLLRKEFHVESTAQARLYITACGLYHAYLNGKKVGSQELTPGFTTYEKRLQYQTYDVTGLLHPGSNVLTVWLGDGWFRGSRGFHSARNCSGTNVALLAQLECAGQVVLATDLSWKATQDGPLRENDTKFGEVYDARLELPGADLPGYNDQSWHGVAAFHWPMDTLVGTRSVPVTAYESFRPVVRTTPNGETVLDFGQNMSGFVRFSVRGPKGTEVALFHGEVMDKNGNFTLDNFDTFPLTANHLGIPRPEKPSVRLHPSELPEASFPGSDRKMRLPIPIEQRVTYILKGEGIETYQPMMGIYGFRYVLLKNWPEPVRPENFTAYAVYSRVEDTLDFCCSHSLLNQFFHNTRWSMKSNFVDVPTDCPTRERSGFTGDGQIFVHTGAMLADSAAFYRKWLEDVAASQGADGLVPCVAPDYDTGGNNPGGCAGWGDGAVIIPYALYETYGDRGFLETFYPMMKGWISYILNACALDNAQTDLSRNPYHRYLWDTGFQWGEWLEPRGPEIPSQQQSMSMNGKPEEGTAFLSYSARITSQTAAILGHTEEAAYYADVAEKARLAYLDYCTDHGRIDSLRQCKYVRPLKFGLLDISDRPAAAQALNELVIRKNYHLNTGFLSTAFLCETLADSGYEDTAFRLLLQTSAPSWLYSVTRGCTTVPESWDCYLEDNSPNSSFNHYAYGAVIGWVVNYIAGLRIEPLQHHITVAPHPIPGEVDSMSICQHSILGDVRLSWNSHEEFQLELSVPANTTATVHLPDGTVHTCPAGIHYFR